MRTRLLVLAGLLAGALAGLVSSAQPWWRVLGEQTNVQTAATQFTGSESTAGLSQALVVVALAGALLLLALRGGGIRVLGGLLALAGAGMAALGTLGVRPNDAAVRARVRQTSLAEQYELVSGPWPLVYAAAGVLVLAAAVLAVATAARWPRRADRFRRGGSDTVEVDGSDPTGWWRALDTGVDPTAAAAEPTGIADRAQAPDVRNAASPDTMGASADTNEPISDKRMRER